MWWNRIKMWWVRLKKEVQREEGQSLAEYALILALIAVVAIAALTLLGGNVSGILEQIAKQLGGG